MSDDLKQRLNDLAYGTGSKSPTDAITRIEQLERDQKQSAKDYCALMEKHAALHVNIANAIEYLRKIVAYAHIGTHKQGIVQNSEARIARTALAKLEGKE